jgi:hypothetical protein
MKIIPPILSVLILLGVGYLVYERAYTSKSNGPVTTMPSTFTVSDENFAADLLGRSVTLPAGQLWGFNTDQRLTTKVVSRKALDDNVVVVVDVTAHANIVSPNPPSLNEKEKDKDAKKPPPPGTPKLLTLSGLAKMYYERINGQWYLTQVEGVSLKVTAE